MSHCTALSKCSMNVLAPSNVLQPGKITRNGQNRRFETRDIDKNAPRVVPIKKQNKGDSWNGVSGFPFDEQISKSFWVMRGQDRSVTSHSSRRWLLLEQSILLLQIRGGGPVIILWTTWSVSSLWDAIRWERETHWKLYLGVANVSKDVVNLNEDVCRAMDQLHN